MSIAPPVGALSAYLSRQARLQPQTWLSPRDDAGQAARQALSVGLGSTRAPSRPRNMRRSIVVGGGTLFEELGLLLCRPDRRPQSSTICCPILKQPASEAETKGPVLLHIVTKKGKGYGRQPRRPTDKYACASTKFDVITGEAGARRQSRSAQRLHASVFADALVTGSRARRPQGRRDHGGDAGRHRARYDSAKRFPDRTFSTSASPSSTPSRSRRGMATEGLASRSATIYSTFLQRGYDQLVHDVACCKTCPCASPLIERDWSGQ